MVQSRPIYGERIGQIACPPHQVRGALAKTLGRMWVPRNSVEAADFDFRAFDSPIGYTASGSERGIGSL